jgi:uncharacterized membrane protein YheB (UPF0754 family)
LDIEQVVISKINAIPPRKLEEILHEKLASEFRLLSLLGAAAGLLIGVVQLVILLFLS